MNSGITWDFQGPEAFKGKMLIKCQETCFLDNHAKVGVSKDCYGVPKDWFP